MSYVCFFENVTVIYETGYLHICACSSITFIPLRIRIICISFLYLVFDVSLTQFRDAIELRANDGKE